MAKSHKIRFKQAWQKCKRYQLHRLGENTNMPEITSGSHVQSKKTKAWHEFTKCIEQNSLTNHEPKRHRRYDGTSINIASFITRFRLSRKQSMALTELRRHLCELDSLITRKCMTKQAYLQQENMFMKLIMARESSQHAWITSNIHGKIEYHVNILSGTFYSKSRARLRHAR